MHIIRVAHFDCRGHKFDVNPARRTSSVAHIFWIPLLADTNYTIAVLVPRLLKPGFTQKRSALYTDLILEAAQNIYHKTILSNTLLRVVPLYT